MLSKIVRFIFKINSKLSRNNCRILLGNRPVSVGSQTDQTDQYSTNINRGLDECPLNNDDKVAYPKRAEASLLRKSKKLLISLIDKELQNVQSGRTTLQLKNSLVHVPGSYGDSKQLKLKCIDKITEELAVLKGLEGVHG